MPPDQPAQPEATSSSQVQQQIQQGLNAEPKLRSSNIGVKVDENSVVLTGSVESKEQREEARHIAQSYAGDRKLVDKIKLTKQT